jgi:hypothetical protein
MADQRIEQVHRFAGNGTIAFDNARKGDTSHGLPGNMQTTVTKSPHVDPICGQAKVNPVAEANDRFRFVFFIPFEERGSRGSLVELHAARRNAVLLFEYIFLKRK